MKSASGQARPTLSPSRSGGARGQLLYAQTHVHARRTWEAGMSKYWNREFIMSVLGLKYMFLIVELRQDCSGTSYKSLL